MVKCLACKSINIEVTDTKVSDFLAERIFDTLDNNAIPTKLFCCKECGFGFYEKRLTSDEERRLYKGYRSDEYQEMRQKSDVWYTPEINSALGEDENDLKLRRAIIERIVNKNIRTKIRCALDYGGDMGQKYPEGTFIEQKYVYDISGVDTLEGVIGFKTLESARTMNYDFVMCNQVLEHIGDLDSFIGDVKSIGNRRTWFYFDVPFDTPFQKSFLNNFQYIFNPYFKIDIIIKHFFRTRKQGYFAPMSEHVNFFTPDSIKKFLARNGFVIYDCEVNPISDVLGKGKIISVLCKME